VGYYFDHWSTIVYVVRYVLPIRFCGGRYGYKEAAALSFIAQCIPNLWTKVLLDVIVYHVQLCEIIVDLLSKNIEMSLAVTQCLSVIQTNKLES